MGARKIPARDENFTNYKRAMRDAVMVAEQMPTVRWTLVHGT